MKFDHSILSAYVDGELDSPWKEMLEKRLSEDPALAAELRRLEAVGAHLQGLPEPPWEARKSEIWSRIQVETARGEPQVWHPRRALSWPAGVAAAAVLIAGSLWAGFTWGAGVGQNPEQIVAKLSPQQIMALVEKTDAKTDAKLQIPTRYNFEIKGEGRLLHMATFQRETQ